MFLLRKEEVSRVSSLFFLMPGTTAVMGTAILATVPSETEMLGLAVAGLGVALVMYGNIPKQAKA